MSTRRRVLLALAAVLVGVAVTAGVAAFQLAGAARDLRSAERSLDRAGQALEGGRLEDARRSLEQAKGRLVQANNALYSSPALDVAGAMPGVSDNLESLRSSVELALVMADGGVRVLRAGRPLESTEGRLEVPLADGAIPLGAVSDVRVELESLLLALPANTDETGSGFLLGPVDELRQAVVEEAIRRRDQISNVARSLEVVEELSGGNGPRRYLIAVANTAEMRGAGGMILSYGILESADGDFELGAFGRIDEIALAEPLPPDQVSLPSDYLQRWQGFDVVQRWRNATMSGDFELVAPTLLEMFTQATGLPVDGVIQIDPDGLAGILEGTGPVSVPELGVVTADNVVDLVLNRAYLHFPDIDDRSDVLGEVAEATFDRLVSGNYPSLRPLGDALVERTASRHLLMYSDAPRVQGILQGFGASGSLPEPGILDTAQLTVQNISANKLDFYLDTELTLSGDRPIGAIGDVQAQITLSNTAPSLVDEPRYVFGPFDDDETAGHYRGIVTLSLPRGTTLVGSAGDDTVGPPIAQTEDGRVVVSYSVDVPPGERHHLTLDLHLPPRPRGPYSLTLIPQPRVRDTVATVNLTDSTDTVRGSVPLDETWEFLPGEPARPAGDT